MIRNTIKLTMASLLFVGLVSTGCKNMNKSQKGVVIGAGAGGAVGAGVGKAAGNTALGAIIGATVGGVTGGIIGRQMDKQAQEIEKIPGAEVKRVGEGINITFESGVLFEVNQADLSASAKGKIKELGDILRKYPDTYILIEGHTDDTGADSYNMTLSKKRASAVSDFLRTNNIAANRLKTAWYGENQPKVPNTSDANRSQNRRVEFAIYANEKMVDEAKKQG
jgi:outer membrane protein OmpA-like peptidoglycan-associated protein